MRSKELQAIYSESDRIIKELQAKDLDDALRILEEKEQSMLNKKEEHGDSLQQ